jgi:hypothetical protein
LNGRPLGGRPPDERSPDEREENFGRSGFAVFENDPLGFPGVDGRRFDGRPSEGRALEVRGLKPGRVGLSPSLTNGRLGRLDSESRESARGVKVDPDGFLPYFAKALGLANFGGRSPFERGENSGRFGFEVLPNDPVGLGVDGRAPDGPRPKLGFVRLLSALGKAPAFFPDIEARESGRCVNFGLAGLSPKLLNNLSVFVNVEVRGGAERGTNLG